MEIEKLLLKLAQRKNINANYWYDVSGDRVINTIITCNICNEVYNYIHGVNYSSYHNWFNSHRLFHAKESGLLVFI